MDNKTRYQKFRDCFYSILNWAFLALIIAYAVNEHMFYSRMCEELQQARTRLDKLLEELKCEADANQQQKH